MRQEELIGQRVRAALSDHQWRQSDLVRATGLDKNTISAIVNGRRRASDATLGRIETAFGMTSGTLGATGGDAPREERDDVLKLAGVSLEDLLAVLTHKVLGLREENVRLQKRVDELEVQPQPAADPESEESPALLHPVPPKADSIAARVGIPETSERSIVVLESSASELNRREAKLAELVPDWARGTDAQSSAEPKGLQGSPGEGDLSRDPRGWSGERDER